MEILFQGSDNLVQVSELKNEMTDTYINDATISAQVKSTDGVAIGSPVSLAQIEGTDGLYRGIIDAALDVDIGDRIDVEVSISAPGGLERTITRRVIVKRDD